MNINQILGPNAREMFDEEDEETASIWSILLCYLSWFVKKVYCVSVVFSSNKLNFYSESMSMNHDQY